MKNLFLTSVATLLAAASFAQNTATVTQTGTSQTANASQTGTTLTAVISQSGTTANNINNLGVTIQTGRNHSATINQNNGSTFNRAGIVQVNLPDARAGANSATVSQSNGSGGSSLQTGAPGSAVGTEGNWAGIAQVGSANSASIVADGAGTQANFGEVWQKGATNTGTVTQSYGSTNTAQIFQGDDTRGGTQAGTNVQVNNNTAVIGQGRTNAGDQNFTAGVLAESISNTATITQIADGNSATILQGATANVDADPASSAGRAAGSKATITQSAIGNIADITQGGESGESVGSLATVIQTGATSNTATIVQGGLNFGKDVNGIAFIQQAGTASAATIAQGFLGVTTSSTATITQTAAANSAEAFIYQAFGGNSTSTNDKAGITQGGSGDNFAQIIQGTAANTGTATSSGNSASITQGDATSNSEALINQGRDAGGNSVNNVASINQIDGNLNAALISQGRVVNVTDGTGAAVLTGASATNSTATVTQSGDNNIGQLYQAGSGHIATLTQTGSAGGSGNSARLYQLGADGIATIVQTGNGNVLDGGVAGSVAIQNGTGNTLAVTQTQTGSGAANVAHVNQAGNMNTMVISQNNGMTVTP